MKFGLNEGGVPHGFKSEYRHRWGLTLICVKFRGERVGAHFQADK
jgi:hypothetical protein